MIGANVIVLGNVSDANIEDVCGQKIEVLWGVDIHFFVWCF